MYVLGGEGVINAPQRESTLDWKLLPPFPKGDNFSRKEIPK